MLKMFGRVASFFTRFALSEIDESHCEVVQYRIQGFCGASRRPKRVDSKMRPKLLNHGQLRVMQFCREYVGEPTFRFKIFKAIAMKCVHKSYSAAQFLIAIK